MKKSAKIMNVARGGVIKADDLIEALDNGEISQAAIDVFEKEPPNKDDPLLKHDKIVVTPHLGASTKEAQEEVSLEIAESVVVALEGGISPNSVNAPVLEKSILKELQSYASLATGLGRTALNLLDGQFFQELEITYYTSRNSDLDTRLLRAMVLKGILEPISDTNINIVNADLAAKNKGLRIKEITIS